MRCSGTYLSNLDRFDLTPQSTNSRTSYFLRTILRCRVTESFIPLIRLGLEHLDNPHVPAAADRAQRCLTQRGNLILTLVSSATHRFLLLFLCQ